MNNSPDPALESWVHALPADTFKVAWISLPASIQEFLLSTAILNPLSGPLCDAVTERTDSREILEELVRTNAFVSSLDRQCCWFRYHALFAETLRYQLERTNTPLLSVLHQRASRWYAEHNQIREAVQHALQGQNWEQAANLIEPYTAVPLCNGPKEGVQRSYEEAPLSLQWLEQFPVEIVQARPRLALYYARMLFIAGRLRGAEHWAQAAEKSLNVAESPSALGSGSSIETGFTTRISGPGDHGKEQLLGEIAARRAVIAAYYGESQAAQEQCRLMRLYLPEQDIWHRSLVAVIEGFSAFGTGLAVPAARRLQGAGKLMQTAGIPADAINCLSMAVFFFLMQGQLHEANRVLQQAIELGTPPGGHPLAAGGIAFAYKADLLREWNQVDTALEQALQGISFVKQTNYTLYLDTAYMALVRIHLSRGEVEAAEAALQQALQLPTLLNNSYRRRWLTTVEQVRVWLACGDLEQAALWAEQVVQGERSNFPFIREREDVARARILLARGLPGEALALLEPLIPGAAAAGRFDHVIGMRLLQALAYSQQKKEQVAFSALAHALRLGEPEGYIRRFVDEGPAMAALLSRYRDQQCRRAPTPYLDTILAAFPQESGAARSLSQSGLLEPLSERELEVLHEMARGASNQEIADTLVIAVGTAKRHVGNILGKLEAKNRTQAVAKARSLGLLSDESMLAIA